MKQRDTILQQQVVIFFNLKKLHSLLKGHTFGFVQPKF